MINEEYGHEEVDETEYYAVRPNKTLIKQEMAVLFTLGEQMAALSAAHIKSLELPEVIDKAVVEVSKMAHTGARKRLLKYIAGHLHKIDVDPILARMARITNKSAHAVREHHLAEQWRDKLIAEGNEALTEFLYEHDYADRQQLRQLMRNAQKEADTQKPPKSSRLLYRYLKELLQTESEEVLESLSHSEAEEFDEEFDDESEEFDENEFDKDED